MTTGSFAETKQLLHLIYNKLADSDNRVILVEEWIKQAKKRLEEKGISEEKSGKKGTNNVHPYESHLSAEYFEGLYSLRRELINHNDDLIEIIAAIESKLTGSQKREVCDSWTFQETGPSH